MQNNLRANIELGTNIVIAICLLVVVGIVVKRYAFPTREAESLQKQSQKLVGTRIAVSGVNWSQNKKSLVFFLKKDCIYCTKSAPFYRELIQAASSRNVSWLAILPDSLQEGREYVKSLELPIENVHTGSLAAYHIPGTPTVMFVDNQGIVKSAWVGAVPGGEKEMRDKLVALFDADL